ncbi:MAG: DUF6295 family protein [Mycobacteriales bacterium]
MCTYRTERLTVSASGKGAGTWRGFTQASVYYDHPVHQPAEHTLNIDLLAPEAGPGARLAVELTPDSARALAAAILATLDSMPAGSMPVGYNS